MSTIKRRLIDGTLSSAKVDGRRLIPQWNSTGWGRVMGRTSNGEGSIGLRKDGRWHAYISMGNDVNGKPVRAHLSRKTRKAVAGEKARLERERDRSRGRHTARPGKTTVADYIIEWLEIVQSERAPSTWHGYRAIVRNYVKGYRLYDLTLAKVTIRDIDQWLIELSRKSNASNALKARRAMSAMGSAAPLGDRLG